MDKISMSEAKKGLDDYCMITDIARLDDVLRKFKPRDKTLVMAPVILMTSEPSNEEAIFDVERLTRWLGLYGLQPYHIRISGHYYPYELKTIIQRTKPKKIVPIHTLFPEFLCMPSK